MTGRRKLEMRNTWLKEGKVVADEVTLKAFMVK